MKTIHQTWNDSPGAVTLIDAHHHLTGFVDAQASEPGGRDTA
jgi:hypothetical protein